MLERVPEMMDMKTCAAGALFTERSKRGSSSSSPPGRLGIPICTGGNSARSSDSGVEGGLRCVARDSSSAIAGSIPEGGDGVEQPQRNATTSMDAARVTLKNSSQKSAAWG